MVTRAEVVALDKQYVWHPYTPMDRYIAETEPLVVERAEGSRFFDADGRSYLDANSSWWVALLGHNHPRLVKTLRTQSQKLCHVALAGITHEPAAKLAQELCAIAPAGLEKVFYSDDGSTAVELALKMSLQYWNQNGRPKRRRFVALSDAFHGETLGVTAIGGVEVFRKPFAGALLECIHLPQNANTEEAAGVLRQLLEQGADEIAAVIMEPMVQGAGGMKIYSPELLSQARALTLQHDVFLVVDEVFTGYGRTGPMWACEHAGIAPDILCIGKGFTGGILPMAATLANRRLFDGFLGSDDRALFYGHTYCGHPLGAAIAREVLAIYREERILEQAQSKAARLAGAIARWALHPEVSQPRALGMVGAVKVGNRPGSDYLRRAGWRVAEAARERGIYLRPLGDVVYIAPPLNIPDADLEELLSGVGEAIEATL